ncbi:Gamma interferon inducible lysosomal thiol reductase GILT [Metarhizium album ARSEF 1941]|uniref:Gamma interferon inducible lysosomal thiol reductase GILT n=1 Tax=Metarhizium album (strain ARSEF 1941) TaxID=1081103 RepID=A0A0B2WQ69_METAS|nr:Gamma interferon inducible lysosomal thiol reductase GILT [Metarhizium album ARSEF 1941]KHN98191.1 Gamma interferon inducible lysosomal thiol reductase GILT [Metarhizium album ARSEF 1941]
MAGKQQLTQGISSGSLTRSSSMPSLLRLGRYLLPALAVVLLLRGIYDVSHRRGFAVRGAAHLVPLEAHIISKCPDTRDALRELILPAMQRVYDKVDFQLNYIGTPTDNDGVECKHGPSECMGNIIELCARELYPDPKINLGFIMCLTRDYRHIPEPALVQDCALEHAIDIKAINECAARDDGAHGMALLRNSIQRTSDLHDSTQ